MATPEENQMEMMLEGGGLNEQGGTVDPVSGNEVPDGATQEGVRDDVPAMLSEGEYVMNEASTRYHGVNKFNEMQNEAKQGYSQMGRDGLLGEEVDQTEEALPFGMADLNVADEEGRELMMADGGLVPKGFNHGGTHEVSTVRKLPTSSDNVGTDPIIERRPQPTFGDSMGGGGGFTFKMYTHPDGRNMMVPFMNGIPMFNIPEGFVLTDPNAPVETPVADPIVTPAEVVKPVEFEGGPDGAGDAVSMEDMTPEDRQKARDFYNNDSKLKSVLTAIPFTRYLVNQGEKSLRSYDRKSLDVDIQNENKKRDMKEAIAKAETKVKRDAEIKSQQELFAKLAADKAAADKRNEQLAKEVEAANLNKDVYNVSNPNVKDVEIAEAVAAEGKPAAGIPTVGGPAGSNAYTGGPDGYSGTGPDGYSGGDANSGGDFSGADFGGSFGYFNQGGLAGKKPKKKMKTYKKGGLATSKK